ncbi:MULTISPECIES: hypothetical protein [unclassified Oceanispirochaeta]|uniref:hypothetical protein n=1 Tax=unclassified Oceanispirochaeta TaxID=2635722 RepID=UPI000E096515|nr:MULTISPECIES: hypothetical protein [unclassified Oceanispirochaeta]MBF9015261.1 hypothetical protein [Oceanispirochaeta sp. M2]NPD71719.1 hypothetical protein [Oceanispirochaeta sp. M1]RDG32912.1 hypothetical protein DV872_06380 [Oceanispirochaeta sp. M1]
MILIFRKYIVRILLYLSGLALIIVAVWSFLNYGNQMSRSWAEEQIWWTLYSDIPSTGLLKALSLSAQLLFAFLMSLIISNQIKRNPSAELSFFYLFLFSFSLQIFRLPNLIDPSHFLADSGLITRIIYFSRILALTALFSASLFSSGLQIQKFGMVLLLILLTAFTLSSILPINISSISGALLNRIAKEEYLALLCIILELLTVLTYISAAYNQGRPEYYRLATLSLLIIAGYEMLFFLHTPFIIPGFACLLPGTILFIRTSRKLFLWS